MELAVGLLEGLHGDLQGVVIRLVAVDGALQLVQLCVDEQGVSQGRELALELGDLLLGLVEGGPAGLGLRGLVGGASAGLAHGVEVAQGQVPANFGLLQGLVQLAQLLGALVV